MVISRSNSFWTHIAIKIFHFQFQNITQKKFDLFVNVNYSLLWEEPVEKFFLYVPEALVHEYHFEMKSWSSEYMAAVHKILNIIINALKYTSYTNTEMHKGIEQKQKGYCVLILKIYVYAYK